MCLLFPVELARTQGEKGVGVGDKSRVCSRTEVGAKSRVHSRSTHMVQIDTIVAFDSLF